MFIEINEVGRYRINFAFSSDYEYITVLEGKVLINTNEIRCVSIAGFDWEDENKKIIKEGSQRYCVYFDKDRSINTDLESYNKIKDAVIKKEDNLFE